MSDSMFRVNGFDDAVVFLSYMAKHLKGEGAEHCKGVLDALVAADASARESRARCIELSRRLEAIEAKGVKRL